MVIRSLFLLSILCSSIHSFISIPIPSPYKTTVSQMASSSDASVILTDALEAHKAGDLKTALENYNRLILMPLNPSTMSAVSCNAGAIYMSIGDYDTASDFFRRGVDMQPENANAHYNLAVTLTSKLGRHSEALPHIEAALLLGYDSTKSLHLKGNILQDLGREAEAHQCFMDAEDRATAVSEGERPLSIPAELTSVKRFMESKVNDIVTTNIDGESFTMTCLSERPLVFYVKDIITDDECAHIIQKTQNKLEKSFVMGGSNTYDSSVSEEIGRKTVEAELYRLSFNAWLPKDEVLLGLQQRISSLMDIPMSYVHQYSEELQVVNYLAGGRFNVHHDSSSFHPRFLTALFYLNSVRQDASLDVSGGTWFPFAGSSMSTNFSMSTLEAINFAQQSRSPLRAAFTTEDGQVAEKMEGQKEENGLIVLPRKGDAVIFFNHLLSDGTTDAAAVHAGLPLYKKEADGGSRDNETEVSGSGLPDDVKWIANYWLGR